MSKIVSLHTALCALVILTGCNSAPAMHQAQRQQVQMQPQSISALPTIQRRQLPPEGQQTLNLIERGGPFPYTKDGVVFGNYEGILPKQNKGYYHEYTVPTPGASTRGMRRIVCGPLPECYYTSDHYATFSRILP